MRGYIAQRSDDRGPRATWASLTDGGPEDVHTIRIAAWHERQADRALFERYVAIGINPEDAIAVIEHDAMLRDHAAPRSPEGSPADQPEAAEPPQPPRIFLADASPGLPEEDAVRGIWLDAAVDEMELEQAVHELLRTSPATGPLAYRIAAASGFEGYELSGNDSLATVARVAQGIAEHGRAFVAYLDAWGATQEAVDEFARYYVGTWPNVAAWAESVVEDRGWWDQLNEHAPPELLPHLRIDHERLGRELTYEHHVVEDEEREQVHVFRLHA
ncbi:hypothetical protein BJF78_07330 [Pseudonocardia sp. CNS-139]|nr:hypothetical protein BJF78_07330 [Pseudonocardia sp. CNS-139]